MTAYDLSIAAPSAFLIVCLAIAVVCAFSMRKASRIVAFSTWLFGIVLIQLIMAWAAVNQYRMGNRTAIAIAIAAEIVIILFEAKAVTAVRKRYPAGNVHVGLQFFIATLAGLLYAAWAAIVYARTSDAFQLAVAIAGALSPLSIAAVVLLVCYRQGVRPTCRMPVRKEPIQKSPRPA